MSEHLSSQQIERYCGRTMSSAELFEASDHLSGCTSCRQLVGESEQIDARFSSLRAELRSEVVSSSAHLLYEQLASYVDGASDEVETEIVSSHLEVCSMCEAEAQDLRAFKAERLSYSGSRNVRAAKPPLRKLFDRFRQRPLYRIALNFGGVAAALLLIVWGATLPLRNQVAELRTRLDEAQQRNDDLQKQALAVEDLQAQLRDLQQSQLESSAPLDRALYDAGRIVVVDKQGNVTGIEPTTTQVQPAIVAALTNNHVTPELSGLHGRAGVLLGGSGEGVSFALVTPVGTGVETDRPTFRWRALPGATSYVVNVYDSKLQNVATSSIESLPEWTPASPLKRGEVYTWQVTATKAGQEITSPVPPAPEARFKVLDQSKMQEVSHIRNSYPESHLVLGSVYSKAGLLDDAEREFKALLSANPHSAVAQKLLQNVRSLRQK